MFVFFCFLKTAESIRILSYLPNTFDYILYYIKTNVNKIELLNIGTILLMHKRIIITTALPELFVT